jgi:recombination protein RecA
MARKKSRKLDATVARIQARFGPRALTRGAAPGILGPTTGRQTAGWQTAGQQTVGRLSVPHIPTGYPELDALLEIGGLPKGKVCEIVGQPTSGKTTLTLRFLAQAQAHGPVAYLDQARFFDADYAHRFGLDLSRLLVGMPYDLTECLSAAEALAQSETLSALVIDALEELWLDAETAQQMGAFLNRLTAPLARSGLVLLVVHDGEPREVRGSPLAHHAAPRLGVRREKWLKKHGDVRGCRARVEVLKSRLGPSGRSVSIAIEWGGSSAPGSTAPADGLRPHEET